MTARPFRFAVGGPRVMTARELREAARRAEGHGYSVLTFPDHFSEQLAPVPAMAMVAECTDRLRVGTVVLGNDYRHPAVVAKEAATIDLLSEGRLELGMGAGWMASDYTRTGLPFDPPGVRIDRLAESVRIIRTLLRDGECTMQGKYYQVADLRNSPPAVQRPHPPILIGGGGRRILQMAAREADIIGLAPRLDHSREWDPGTVSAAATARKIATVREAAGDRFGQLEINVYPALGPVQVTADAKAAVSRLYTRLSGRFARMDMSEADLLDSPHVFIGTTVELVAKLRDMRERFGISYVRVGYESIDEFAPVVAELAGR